MKNTTNYTRKTKEEKKREVNAAIERVNKGIIEYLNSDSFKDYLRVMSKFHNYSLNNQMLIFLQRPTAELCASYSTWQSQNRQVKKGEKGLKIIIPVKFNYWQVKTDSKGQVLYKKDKNGQIIRNEAGEPEPEVEKSGQTGLTYKIGSTFDISQTEQIEGKPELNFSMCSELQGSVKNLDKYINALKLTAPCSIEFIDNDKNLTCYGYFDHNSNEIKVMSNLSELQTLKTLIHEIAHSMLHNSEEVEKLKKKGIELSKQDKEVQAEAVAFIVSDHLGLDTSEYSFPYIASWQGKAIEITKENLNMIRKASHEIIEGLEKNLEGATAAPSSTSEDKPEEKQEDHEEAKPEKKKTKKQQKNIKKQGLKALEKACSKDKHECLHYYEDISLSLEGLGLPKDKKYKIMTDSYMLAGLNDSTAEALPDSLTYPSIEKLIDNSTEYEMINRLDYEDITARNKQRVYAIENKKVSLYELLFKDKNKKTLKAWFNTHMIKIMMQCLNYPEDSENIKAFTAGEMKQVIFVNYTTEEFFLILPVKRYE